MQESGLSDLEQLKEDLMKSGHQPQTLKNLEQKMFSKLETQADKSGDNLEASNDTQDTIVAVTDYFQEISQLKALFRDLEPDISKLTGTNTKVTVASRKGRSIGSKTVKNNKLCLLDDGDQISQKCGVNKCKSCELLCNTGEIFCVNGKKINVPNRFNCKTRNALYLAQCKVCKPTDENTYVGQTTQSLRKRINGHRSCFTSTSDIQNIEKSALAEHCYYKHGENYFDLKNFKFMVYNRVNSNDLNRHESRLITGLRTNVMGLNRCNIQK